MEQHHGTLVANTVDTVALAADYGSVEVLNRGDADIFFTVDGSAPVVEGTGSHVAPPRSSAIVAVGTDGNTVVKLKSAATPKFTVVAGEKVQRQGSELTLSGLSAVVSNWPADQLVHAANLDIAVSALRDAIVKTDGTSNTLADIVAALAELEVKNDTGSPLPVAGQLAVASASFARPNDATPYIAKDVISTGAGAVMDFGDVARVNAGSGYLTKARVMTDDAAIAALPLIRLHLFHTLPAAIADNSPYQALWANRDKRIASVDFNYLTLEGAGSDALWTAMIDLRVPFKCAAASKRIYGILETLTAFTPAANKNWFAELTADLN